MLFLNNGELQYYAALATYDCRFPGDIVGLEPRKLACNLINNLFQHLETQQSSQLSTHYQSSNSIFIVNVHFHVVVKPRMSNVFRKHESHEIIELKNMMKDTAQAQLEWVAHTHKAPCTADNNSELRSIKSATSGAKPIADPDPDKLPNQSSSSKLRRYPCLGWHKTLRRKVTEDEYEHGPLALLHCHFLQSV
jgi:hypothetical protein